MRRDIGEGWRVFAERDSLDAVRAGEDPDVPPPSKTTPPTELWGSPGDGWVDRSVDVPSCWEGTGLPFGYCGPVYYRRRFDLDPAELDDRHAVLRFDAVSYHATVYVNGGRVGVHRGMWDRFTIDITDDLDPSGEQTVLVEVHKPGDHLPIGESLAGFIPYVTTTFGGIWQDVTLETTGSVAIEDVHVVPEPDSDRAIVRVSMQQFGPLNDGLSITVTVGDRSAAATVAPDSVDEPVELAVRIPDPTLWTPTNPHLYTATVELDGPDGVHHVEERFGMRSLTVAGSDLYLNGEPVYPRGVLHWCAYPDRVAPIPDREQAREELQRMQELGYNMVKFCLVIPPDVYFDVADELGMLVWVEFPMWNPTITDDVRERLPGEYRRLVRRVRTHPSVFAYTIGCELSDQVDAELLETLYDLVKAETGCPLIRDNSGSAEAYGGVPDVHADFYDYHFYAETNQFPDLLPYFLPDWRDEQPLLFGEYADSDTFRSVAELRDELEYDLWWATDDPVENPQGVRWAYDIVTNEDRLADLSLPFAFDEIRRRSYAQSSEYRKDLIEQTRQFGPAAGYTVTNIMDTPISTSGMLDDLHRHKFDPGRFRHFNGSTVITRQRDRRRIWLGADRPQYLDEACVWHGDRLRVNIVLAHHGEPLDDPVLTVTLSDDSVVLATNTPDLPRSIEPPLLQQVGVFDVHVPEFDGPRALTLSATLSDGGSVVTTNEWTYWALPPVDLERWTATVWDPRSRFPEIESRAPNTSIATTESAVDPSPGDVVLATAWSESIAEWRTAGAGVVVMVDRGDHAITEPRPFWREGIGLVHDHPLVDALPHDGYPGLAFKGITPEVAIDRNALERELNSSVEPVVSRLDARDFQVHGYLERGDGMVATAFKFSGGFGRQPIGLGSNVLGTYLLDRSLESVRADLDREF